MPRRTRKSPLRNFSANVSRRRSPSKYRQGTVSYQEIDRDGDYGTIITSSTTIAWGINSDSPSSTFSDIVTNTLSQGDLITRIEVIRGSGGAGLYLRITSSRGRLSVSFTKFPSSKAVLTVVLGDKVIYYPF